MGEDMPPEKQPDRENMAAQTAVIPKEFFGSQDIKVGEEYYFRVDKIMDKEVMVSYAKGDEGEGEKEGEEMPPEPPPKEGMGGNPGMYD